MGALYGILGIVVAIGVGSWLQSRRNDKKVSWARRAGETALIVVVAGAGAFAASFGTQYLRSYLQAGDTPTVAQLEIELRNQGFRLFDAFRQELPAEYEQTMNELISTIKTGGSNSEVHAKGTELLAKIRRKYADKLLEASDDHLVQILRSNLDALQMVSNRETVERCAQFAVLGPVALGIPDRTYQAMFDEGGTKLFRAIGAAKRDPKKYEAATEDDWGQVAESFFAIGGTDVDITMAVEADPLNPETCRVTDLFLRAVLSVDGDAGRRIRAEMAYAFASGG